MLAPFEQGFLRSLTKDYPITPLALPANSTIAALVAGSTPAYPPTLRKGAFAHPLQYAFSLVEGDSAGGEDSLKGEAESAYRASMGRETHSALVHRRTACYAIC